MTTKLDELNAHISALECTHKSTLELLEQARVERKALRSAAHTWTAADYRIVLFDDESAWAFEDMVGDAPDESDSEEFRTRYQAMYDAYYNSDGLGIFSSIVSIQKRDVESGEFETIEATAGLFYLDTDSQRRIFAEARDMAQDFIDADGIVLADVPVISEGDL